MKYLALAVLFVMVYSNTVFANWRMYWKDKNVIANVDYLSHAPFHDQPAIWVKWHYVTPRKGVGGSKIQFTADCSKHRLSELAAHPYDVRGNYLKADTHYDSPKEYKVTPGSLHEATYKLLCH